MNTKASCIHTYNTVHGKGNILFYVVHHVVAEVESPAVGAEVRSQNFPSGEQIETHLPVQWAG